MTLSTRNRLLFSGFLASILALIMAVFTSIHVFGSLSTIVTKASGRSSSIFALPLTNWIPASPYAAISAVLLSVIFSLIAVMVLYYSFENTHAPEILFFAFFALSFLVEALRTLVPLSILNDWPPAIIVGTARAISFSRFFGLLSFFAASVYATGVDFQKHSRVLVIIFITSLTIASGIPVDGLTWDASFTPISGYKTMFELVEFGIAIISILGFLVAGRTRGAGQFPVAAIGGALVFIGRDILLHTDSWIGFPIGTILLTGGSWLITAKIHRYYLWL